MHEVNVGHKSLADYRSIVPKDLMAEIDELGEQLKGRQVLHVNATAFGGGVAEILYTLVPLVNDIGLEAHWQILTAPQEFYNVTKSFHNGLQGHAVDFPPESRALYEEVCRANAAELTRPVRLRRHPRPAAARHPRLRLAEPGPLHLVDLALPHRHVHARPGPLRLPAAVHQPLRRGRVHAARLRAAGPHRAGARDRADHRPARAQEHAALARGRALHRAPVRHRRGAPAPAPGLALRPVEGPAGRRRRLPRGQGQAPGRAARAGGLHGQRRPGGLGVPRRGHRLRGRRPRRVHPLQPRQRRRGGDQRVPEPRRRDPAEVHARGVRAHRVARGCGRRGR